MTMTRIAVSLALAALVAAAGPALAQAPSADDAAILGVISHSFNFERESVPEWAIR